MKILIARTDRLGDVVLTLPMAEALKRLLPGVHVAMLLRHYTAPLLEHHPDIDEIVYYDTPAGELKKFREIREELRRKKFDVAFIPSPRFRLAYLLREAEIPKRIGTGYRWYSALFTDKIYEHRHDAGHHEAQYNVRMLRSLGLTLDTPLPKLYPGTQALTRAQRILKELGIVEKKFFILHPGTGGSTKTAPLSTFTALATSILANTTSTILITASATDQAEAEEIAGYDPARIKILPTQTDLETFAAVISFAKGFVAHSTGPLHIAAALGVPTIGLYSPVIPMSRERWGPLGNSVATIKPPLDIQCPKCLLEACPYFDCMDMISPNEIASRLQTMTR